MTFARDRLEVGDQFALGWFATKRAQRSQQLNCFGADFFSVMCQLNCDLEGRVRNSYCNWATAIDIFERSGDQVFALVHCQVVVFLCLYTGGNHHGSIAILNDVIHAGLKRFFIHLQISSKGRERGNNQSWKFHFCLLYFSYGSDHGRTLGQFLDLKSSNCFVVV